VASVIAAIDGRGDRQRKSRPDSCRRLSEVLQRAQAAERDVLSATTVAHLADNTLANDWVL
jgi:hypothetical protein